MKILIVCTGNTCRSPMAEGIFNELKQETDLDVQVLSAGIAAIDGGKISDYAIKAMEELHDISHYRSMMVNEDLLNQADLILTMTRMHKDILLDRFEGIQDKTYLLKEYAFGVEEDVEDPFGGNLHNYMQARDEIYIAIEKIIEKLAG